MIGVQKSHPHETGGTTLGAQATTAASEVLEQAARAGIDILIY